ncbi:hypothetical protein K3G39_13685 [Pontibacter sp. HSC-14F20]|uniref:hypothetical protein n=1 Tax=Pontibacter sp. HSC-14F20 TaxID=2864136 RepID=UPI001C735D90|nr:hypothetical protein [Pontibacter sp. HSC-14F20]MBX0334290.1 hypothetical protein [Pontibacter sp. HSC-14F20]
MNLQLFEKSLERDCVTIRHNPEDKMIWNQWRGNISSGPLREAMIFACDFTITHEVELILADFTFMLPPSLQDQTWIARNAADILQHSKLSRVANVMGSDIFQQISIETIYEIAFRTPLPCESRDFLSTGDALEWLFSTE